MSVAHDSLTRKPKGERDGQAVPVFRQMARRAKRRPSQTPSAHRRKRAVYRRVTMDRRLLAFAVCYLNGAPETIQASGLCLRGNLGNYARQAQRARHGSLTKTKLNGTVAMIVLLRAVPVVLVLTLVCAGATAQPVSFPAPMQPVRPGADRTYADLVRLVVPGVVVKGEKYSGGDVIAVRNIDGGDLEHLEPESMEALRVAAMPVRSGGLDRTALLLDFGSGKHDVGLAILALFDVADKPRLLDAANVASGRFTSFLAPGRLSVGVGDDLLMTRSTHFNSSQGYTTVALIHARNDRLEPVDSIFIFDEKTCAFERTQQLGVRHGGGEPFADITAVVTELTAMSGERCNASSVPAPGTRAITVTYRWDTVAQRYVPDSDAFAVLARENEKRF